MVSRDAEYSRKYRLNKSEELRARQRARHAANREAITQRCRTKYAANREVIAQRRRAEYAVGVATGIKRVKKITEAARAARAARKRAYRAANREKLCRYDRERRAATRVRPSTLSA